MILNLSPFNTTQAAFPDLTETNPKAKTKKYILQYGRAFITNYLQSGSRDFYNARANGRYEKAKLYAIGEQEVKAILKNEDGTPDNDPNKVDLRRPLKLMKKSLRAVDGKLKDHDFVATVTPIDATAQDDRLDYESRLRVWMAHGEFLKSLGLAAPGATGGGQAAGPEIPVDEDELALHMEVKYRHRDAMLLEMKLALALYLGSYAQINRHCLRDETTYGSSAIFLGLRGPRRLPTRLHPGNCFFLPSDTEDYANLQAGAHLEKVSLSQVLQEIDADPDTTLDETQRATLESLAKRSLTNGGRSYYYDDELTGKPELAGQLEVIRFSFKSHDAVVLKEYTNKFGNPQVREKPAGYQGGTTPGKIHRQTFANWYEGTLVVGADIGYGCRKCYEQLRAEDNPFDCHPLYVVTSPDMLGGHTESVVEQCFTLLDTINEAFARLRFKAATMPGSWLEFDKDALENGLIKNAAGKTSTIEDSIRSFFKNGYIITSKQADADEGKTPRNAVTPGVLARDKEIAGEIQLMDHCAAQIADITGINGSISAADPGNRQSVGTTQLAIQGAENTLDYLYFAKQTRFERVVRALAVSLRQSEGRSPLTGPVPAGFPGYGEQVVGSSESLAGRVMEVKIERKPTDQEWVDFYDAAKVALSQKEITLSDYTFIRQVDNLKQAWALLSIRARRNQMQAAEAAQQQTSMASQQAQASATVTAEQQRATNRELHEQNMELQTLKNQGAIAANEVTKQGALDLQQLTAYFKIASEQQARAHEAQQNAQAQEVQLAQHNANLDSQEGQAEVQRQHEAALATQQPQQAA